MNTELVINLHVTERCNYSCAFCFGKWGIGSTDPLIADGVFGDAGRAVLLISDVYATLSQSGLAAQGIRFNFAGGEPALLATLPDIVGHCRALGARTSFVSNGLMLRRFELSWIARNFDLIGLSIDSASAATNIRIGRASRSGRVFDLAEVITAVQELRRLSGCSIKINTVVCRKNVDEDLSDAMRSLAPDTWKVLQMLPVYSTEDAVTSSEFAAFVQRHAEFADVMTVEDNDQMTASYLRIDPLGRFFWTTDGEVSGLSEADGYRYSRPIPEVGAATAYQECAISWVKYAKRY